MWRSQKDGNDKLKTYRKVQTQNAVGYQKNAGIRGLFETIIETN